LPFNAAGIIIYGQGGDGVASGVYDLIFVFAVQVVVIGRGRGHQAGGYADPVIAGFNVVGIAFYRAVGIGDLIGPAEAVICVVGNLTVGVGFLGYLAGGRVINALGGLVQ
jgi:hypothetical protein